MAGTLTPTPFQTVLDATGVAVSGAKIYTYTAGTTTAAATYTTLALDVANANPIVADSSGRYVAYLPAGGNFKFTFKTSGDVLIKEQDNIQAVPGASVNLDITGTVGEAVTAGEVVYLSSGEESSPLTKGLWYLTDSDATATSTLPQSVGMAVSAIAINTAGTIRLAGETATAGSVVVGSTYYVGATPGAIVASAPSNSRVVGVANTTSTLIMSGTTAVAATIPVPITQDLLFTDDTYDIGKSGATRPRDGFFSRNTVVGGTMGVTGIATLTAQPILSSLTASQTVFTDGSKGLVSNAITGTGNVVMSASPTLTGTIGAAALTLSTPLAVPQGGTGVATLTSGNVLVGAGTSDVSSVANISVEQGGTGVASLTANSLLLGAGTSDVTFAAPGSSGNVLTSNGTVWASAAPSASDPVGWGIVASVGSNALTVALTTKDGSTPSAGDPVSLDFRNVTLATGSLSVISVTGAETVVAPDGATLGAASGVPFRAWVVAFNDGGTVRLALINCASSTLIYQLRGWGIASSTTIGTGSDAVQTFYSDAGVSVKAYVILGYVSYESGLSTAGTYDVVPTRAQALTLDTPLPGDTIQQVFATHASQLASTSSTYADTGLTASITPSSASNKVVVRATTQGIYKDTFNQAVNLQLLRATTQIGLQVTGSNGGTGINAPGAAHWERLDSPASASAVTYKVQFNASANTGNVYVQQASSTSTISLTEVMV